MAPRGEIALTLSAEEAQALKDKLEDLRAGDPRNAVLDAILKKIKLAEEKMI
jgi:hypothetical protein